LTLSEGFGFQDNEEGNVLNEVGVVDAQDLVIAHGHQKLSKVLNGSGPLLIDAVDLVIQISQERCQHQLQLDFFLILVPQLHLYLVLLP
jgi:hypothetical protein